MNSNQQARVDFTPHCRPVNEGAARSFWFRRRIRSTIHHPRLTNH
jgi:hypothetical protein